VTVFIDTNILIYAALARESDPRKQTLAASVIAKGNYATSAQVHAEFYAKVTSPKYAMAVADALGWLERLRRFDVVPVTASLVARGAAVALRHQLSYWDGAIIAAAQEIGADTLYSEDLNHGQRYGSVRVVNPFAA
jgi:predicted nucleic acid-binding protein